MQVQVRKKNKEQSGSLPLSDCVYLYSTNSWTGRDLLLSSLAANLLEMRNVGLLLRLRLRVLKKILCPVQMAHTS